jgi:hypothetical protein
MHQNLVRFFARRYVFTVGIFIMLVMAFAQSYKTTHDLNWAYDFDFDRDMSFIQGNLDGHPGQDPSYLGEYLWYSPLLFSIETVIVKTTGLAPNLVVTRAGIYLNCLAPVAFVVMVLMLFGIETAIAALLSFLFLSSGNISGWGAATYSPWLYPVCFVQFLFYLSVIFLYKAVSTQRYIWFILLGFFSGLSFLGHVAPATVIILMTMKIQISSMINAIRNRNQKIIKKYLFQSMILLVTFLAAASPILIVIYGRYRMHYINRAPFEFIFSIFSVRTFGELIKANLNLALLISFAGVYWFYKNFENRFIRDIISSWLLVCLFMFGYSTLVPFLHNRLHISLPVTVPSFHYFFYLKALESVFFGIGLVWLLKSTVHWLSRRIIEIIVENPIDGVSDIVWVALIIIFSLVYYPIYSSRSDFTTLRALAIQKEADKPRVEVYYYLKDHISPDKVILCELGQSMFPVMASGRKMVAAVLTMSNPFVDFEQREKDRNRMLSYLVTGQPGSDKQLFTKYQVSYILLSCSLAQKLKPGLGLVNELVFRNKSFILLSVTESNDSKSRNGHPAL